MTQLIASLGRLIRRFPFEFGVIVAALLYFALRLSPSSYAFALAQLGEPISPTLGVPKSIRSDEWAIVTPLFEVAVNNDFGVMNETSFYGETLLSMFGLPLLNWGIVFKPHLWLFFVLPPSFAYSFYWAALAALMLVGWSILLRQFRFTARMAVLLSMLIFLSPYVQAWWTTHGAQLAFFPWVVIAIVRPKSNVVVTVLLAIAIPIWAMALFYVPQIPPLTILALAMCIAFRIDLVTWRRICAIVSGVAIGAAVTLLYYRPVIDDYMNSVYPGDRWLHGGGLLNWRALSQFFPESTTEGYAQLITPSICEAATVATWLPVLTACVIDYRSVLRRWRSDKVVRATVLRLGGLAFAFGLLTLWQLSSSFSSLSYFLALGLSTEQRTLFASGVLVVLGAGYALDRLPIHVSLWRLGLFAAIVCGAWVAASRRLQPTNELVWRDELLVLLPVAALVPFVLSSGVGANARVWRAALVVVALIPVAVAWGPFNPVQTTTVMFRKPDTAVTKSLDALAEERADGAIAASGFFGGVLNGVGYRSVVHVLPTPSPQLLRPYFLTMNETEFEVLFNRYAIIGLIDEPKPRLLNPDYVGVPISTMSQYAAAP